MTDIARRHALGTLAALTVLPLVGRAFAQAPTTAKPIRIGVVGAGWLGGTVGRAWVKAGHEVMLSSRNPDELRAMSAPLGSRASVGTPAAAAAFGSVILLAVPYEALPALGTDLAGAWRGKVLLDACNPSASSTSEVARFAQANGVGPASAKYLPGTRLVRAFSAVDATAIESSFSATRDKLAVPIASDDPAALEVAAQLVRDAGCEPLIVGDLASATAFQRGGPGFRANTTMPKLRRLMGLADEA